jgi:hypothetical protein
MARHFGTDKDVEKKIREAKRANWIVEITRGNHIKFLPPDNKTIIIGSLTGSSNSTKKLLRDLAKAGL